MDYYANLIVPINVDLHTRARGWVLIYSFAWLYTGKYYMYVPLFQSGPLFMGDGDGQLVKDERQDSRPIIDPVCGLLN